MKSLSETDTNHRHNNLLLNSGGFTLVELMVAVFIIGILVAVAVPVYNTIQEEAAENAHQANIRTIHGAVQNYIGAHGLPEEEPSPEEWEDLLVPDFLDEWPSHPSGTPGNYKVIGGFSYKVIFE